MTPMRGLSISNTQYGVFIYFILKVSGSPTLSLTELVTR
jgi:hypothetical protein